MKTYQALALLLTYPETEWLAHLDEVEELLIAETDCNGDAAPRLHALFALLREQTLLDLQQNYVATFDQNPSHSLHLFEHIHGESRDRGQAMVDLVEEYRKHDLEIDASELPDYVPLFLEYLSILPTEESTALLGDAINVLALIGRKLHANGSPYHAVFDVLQTLSPVAAQPLPEPPVRNMDEAMERFGPATDGREPLLMPQTQVAYADLPKSRRQPTAAVPGI